MPYIKTAYPHGFDSFQVTPVAILTNDMTVAFSPKVFLWYQGLVEVHGETHILKHVTNMINDFIEQHGWQYPLVFLHRDQYFATFIVVMMETGIIFMSPKEAMKCGVPIKVK